MAFFDYFWLLIWPALISQFFLSLHSHDPFEEEDILVELSRKAAAGRVLLLLDGLDEVHGVGSLANIKMPAGKNQFSLCQNYFSLLMLEEQHYYCTFYWIISQRINTND
jgi:hypothetical protein